MGEKSHRAVPKVEGEIPGPNTSRIIEREKRYVWPTLSQHPPVVWDRAFGELVQDVDGNTFIDFTCGVVCTNTGHSHPKVVEAIKTQAEKLVHCYDFAHSVRYKVMEKLALITPEGLKRIMLLTSGTEATEAAIKVARAYTKKIEVVSFYGAFHGRTYLSTSLGSWKVAEYGPYVAGVIQAPYAYCYRCPFDKGYPDCALYCLQFLREAVRHQSSGHMAALIVEPYQGSSGNIIPPKEYLSGLREFCDENEILFIADEIQSGFARTGKFFALEHFGVIPDILLAGKGIASGIPTSMVATTDRIAESLRPGSMSSTYGGNPLSCAAVLATIDVMIEEKLPERAARVGAHMAKRLQEIMEQRKYVGDVRALGLAIALELVEDKKTKKPAPEMAERVVHEAYKSGLLLLNPIGILRNCIRLAPASVISDESADKGVEIIDDALKRLE